MFDYNPQDVPDDGDGIYGGEYEFKIDDIKETTFKTGSEGWSMKLLVGVAPNRDVPVYVNLVNTPKALWKFKEFLATFGLDFMAKPRGGWPLEKFVNKMGRAIFAKDGRYLSVDTFIENSEITLQTSKPNYDYGPPPMSDDDVPF